MVRTVTVQPVQASGVGALSGWEIRCTCGDVHRLSLETMANAHADAHLAYHARTGR